MLTRTLSDARPWAPARSFVAIVRACGLAIVLAIAPAPARLFQAAAPPPNIVFILADDLGWADLGANEAAARGNTPRETPHLDALARGGMRFTRAYAACPVCSPTRASILTGRYPTRYGVTDWLPGRGDLPSQRLLRPALPPGLPLGEATIAEALAGAGYRSTSIGKWHLGGEGLSPLEQGFASNIGGSHVGTTPSYVYPYVNARGGLPGLKEGKAGEYLTDRLGVEAERALERAARESPQQPFFLHLQHYAVHTPMVAREALVERHRALAREGRGPPNAIYAAMLQSLDESVGGVLRKLDELGLAERTIVVFTSDNGGLSVTEGPHTPPTSNAPLRAGKGSLYEGGIRVPLLVRWPGVTRAGSVTDAPVSSIDFLPTFLEAAGLDREAAGAPALDGASLVPVLRGEAAAPRDLYWHYPHYPNQGGKPGGAIVAGSLKLIENFDNGRLELFDLARDPGEEEDVSAARPAEAAALHARLVAWREATGARAMRPNPAYDPEAAAKAMRPIGPRPDGSIVLEARDAVTHGTTVRYEPEPHKDTLGYWTRIEDWASWKVRLEQPGDYEVEVLQGCGDGSGGSEVEVALGGARLAFTVEETGGFQAFRARRVGRLRVEEAAALTLSVRPRTKPGLAVMDLRRVTLRPVAAE